MDCLMPREDLSLAARRGSFFLMALSIGYGSPLVSREDAKTRRGARGRSLVSTRRSVPGAIRRVDSLGESTLRAHRKSRLDTQAGFANGIRLSMASCLRGFV